nr:unnamed protein product [Callosobruchus analis]
MVQEKLSDNYEVREVTGVYPRIKLVGMNCNGDFKIIKHFPTKKNDKIFQAIIQYESLSLIVGLDSCSIFDAIEIYRCFKCNEFHHSSNRCTKAVVCPLCSENHELKQCKSQIRKCTNCSRLHLKDQSVAVDHAVWEKEKCLAYNNSLEQFKRDYYFNSNHLNLLFHTIQKLKTYYLTGTIGCVFFIKMLEACVQKL